MFFLFILMTTIPMMELYLLFKAGAAFGVMNTVAVVLLTGFVGAYLARLQGLVLLRNVQAQLARGEMPSESLLHGVLVLAGGLLLLTPGFITDVIGLLLLIPLTRKLIVFFGKILLKRKIAQGLVRVYSAGYSAGFSGGGTHPVKDAQVTNVRDVL